MYDVHASSKAKVSPCKLKILYEALMNGVPVMYMPVLTHELIFSLLHHIYFSITKSRFSF